MSIQQQVSLRPFNTFGLHVEAENYAAFTNVEELQSLLRHAKEKKWPLFILGGGSNVLLTQDIPGLTLHNQIKGITAIKEDDQYVWVKSGAGEVWHDLVLWTLNRNWGGLENLSLIPGYVGAAPMQNIGAYGVEIKDTFDHLEAVEIATGAVRTFSLEACRFGYRESVFKHELKGQYIITHVVFRLEKAPTTFHTSYGAIQSTLADMEIKELSIQAISNAVIQIRQSKLPDPKKLGNAGSFFKNPVIADSLFRPLQDNYPDIPHYPLPDEEVKIPAAWLIEQSGWKGKRLGATGTHVKQPLVLVNYGGAKGADIWHLAQQIQAAVNDTFGIQLEPEVNVW